MSKQWLQLLEKPSSQTKSKFHIYLTKLEIFFPISKHWAVPSPPPPLMNSINLMTRIAISPPSFPLTPNLCHPCVCTHARGTNPPPPPLLLTTENIPKWWRQCLGFYFEKNHWSQEPSELFSAEVLQKKFLPKKKSCQSPNILEKHLINSTALRKIPRSVMTSSVRCWK